VLLAAALVPLLIVPLGWKEQGVIGTTVIAAAILLNVTTRAPTVTLALITMSIVSTLRYGYFRVTHTWDGITSAGHLLQADTLVVLLLLGAELYTFTTLFLGYFQTVRPLGRQPVPLDGPSSTWPTVDLYIPTYNEPLSVVRATIQAALAIDYPREKIKVFVLDDGRRDEFREYAASVGAGIRRASSWRSSTATTCRPGRF
jgi:cellulose synthase (UDP-forming)